MYGDLSGAQVEQVLRTGTVGHLGCYGDSRPYVVPINYAYDGDHVYGYTREGMKLRLMRAHPIVCLQVDRIEDITSWQSVIAWGTFAELHGDDREKAKNLMIGRFTPLLGGAPIQHAHGMGGWAGHSPTWRDAVLYQITLTTKTGRYENL